MKFQHIAAVAALGLGALALPAQLPVRGASQLYAADTTPLLDADGGKPVGSVAPGTAVTVVAQSAAAAHVTIAGWSALNAPGTVYASTAKRIVEVSGLGGHATFAAQQKVGNVTYRATTVDGWIAAGALVPSRQTVLDRAGKLYAERCSQCHTLQPPDTFSANEWPDTIKNHSPNPGLSPGETALVTFYLQTQTPK